MPTTHYEVLGVPRAASAADIKDAYYARARVYHPDAHVRSSLAVRTEAERAMQRLNDAWNTLRDPRLRAAYDATLAEDATGRRRRGRGTGPGAAGHREPAALASGFRTWLGASLPRTGPNGPRLVLEVTAPTSLRPLQALAPDGVVGLRADGWPLDDGELLHLVGHTALRHLDLSRTAVTDAGLVHLAALPNLEALHLWNTAVTDAGMVVLGGMGSLRELGLGGTAVTDAGLAELARLTGLRRLQLWGSAVTGTGLRHLNHLPELELVSLPRRVGPRHRRALRSAVPGLLVL